MKFNIEKSDIVKALSQFSKVVQARSTLPILGCVHITVFEQKLTLRATDLDLVLSIDIELQGETSDGQIAIPLRIFYSICNEMPNTVLEIENESGTEVTLKSQYGRYSIQGQNAEDFPKLPDLTEDQLFEFSSEDMISIIDEVAYAAATDETMTNLVGMNLVFKDNAVTAVSTDGHRFVRYRISDFYEGDFEGAIIIPSKFLTVSRPLIDKVEKFQFSLSESYARVQLENASITGRLINQKYPDYNAVIPKENDKKMSVNKDDFLASVRRVSIFANIHTHHLIVRVMTDKLEISTQDFEKSSRAIETVPCDFDGDEPMDISFKYNFLKDVVSQQKGDTIIFELKKSTTACIVKTEEEKRDIISLLMPLRV